MHIVSTFSDRLPFLLEELRKKMFLLDIENFSPVFEDVDGNEGKHGGVDDEQQQDGKVKPDKLAHATVEMTTPEQILMIKYFLCFLLHSKVWFSWSTPGSGELHNQGEEGYGRRD